MKYCLLIILCFFCGSTFAQNPNATQIRKQMADIRQSTDWNNPDAAKKANEKIRELSKQLMMSSFPSGQQIPAEETERQKLADEEGAEYRMKLWDQIWDAAKAGENANIDLAKPLREEIKKAYEEDENKQVKNPLFFQEMTFLCIDMSSPSVKEIIAQMENYTSIKTLVITGGEKGAPVDLNQLLSKAAGYPLESLYIINFRNFVAAIPETVAQFQQLKFLGLYNNAISHFPSKMNTLVNLQKLFIDMNPVSVVSTELNGLTNLETLGIAKTQINSNEMQQLAQLLPNCKILTQ